MNLKMKKLVTMVSAAAMIITLFAGSAMAEASESKAEAKGYKIAVCQQHQTNAFQIAITDGATAKAEELGCEIDFFDANQDAATQIGQIESAVTQGYDAILFEPVNPDGLVQAAKDAMDKGVVVVNIVSPITDWEENGISAVTWGDNETAGELEMKSVCELIEGKGDIAILTGPDGDSAAAARYKGYENVLKDYPDVNIVVEADCQWDTAQAQATVESWLVAYDLAAIVCQNDGMAVGAGNAAGKDSGIVITGVDATPDGLEAIGDGRITGTVSQNASAQGSLGVEAAVKVLNGEELEEKDIRTQNIWITSENLDEAE